MNWLRAMLFEMVAIPTIILLQLIGFFWKPSFSGRHSGTPVLLVHGYINTGAIWLYLKWKIRNLGPIYTVDLKSPFNSIENHAKQLEKIVKRIEEETKRKELIIVGYSMGGLVGAYYAMHFARQEKIQKVITISTPFEGTQLARIAIGKNGRQMAVGSSFVRKLKQEISQSKVPFFTIASKTDEIVIPYTSALLNHSRSYVFENLGHGGLIFSPRIALLLSHLIVA
jgi:triacylglycerol lipase